MFNDLYLPAHRVVHDMLPDDVRWRYDQAPPDLAHQMPGCPLSAHPHGVIATSRPLGHHEMNAAKLSPFKPGKHSLSSQRKPALRMVPAPYGGLGLAEAAAE